MSDNTDNNDINRDDLIALLNEAMPFPIDPLATPDAIQPDVWGSLPPERRTEFIDWARELTDGISTTALHSLFRQTVEAVSHHEAVEKHISTPKLRGIDPTVTVEAVNQHGHAVYVQVNGITGQITGAYRKTMSHRREWITVGKLGEHLSGKSLANIVKMGQAGWARGINADWSAIDEGTE